MGKSKHFVMLADYNDKSLMRNVTAMGFAGRHTDNFAPAMTSVTCILNGSYHGVYQFGEHIRVGNERVDIFDWENKASEIASIIGMDEDLSPAEISALDAAMTTSLSWITAKKFTFGPLRMDSSNGENVHRQRKKWTVIK